MAENPFMVLILKCIIISLFIDTWLFWLHVAFHSEMFPVWFRKIHSKHHANFSKDRIFDLGITELALDCIAPFLFTWWLVNWWFFPFVVLPWGVFEAARGHGHFLWFRIIPKWWYKKIPYCGIKYHLYHHDRDESKNLGQFLRIWDYVLGTNAW